MILPREIDKYIFISHYFYDTKKGLENGIFMY